MHRSISFLLLAGLVVTARPAEPEPAPRDGKMIYGELCANCHGPDGAGGRSGSLLGPALKHGADDPSLARSISAGYPAVGMPAFGRALNADEIQSVVVYLHERAANARTPDTTEPVDPAVVRHSELCDYRIETVVDQGLEVPWSFVFLPDGRILLTERAGRLRIIDRGRLVPQPVENIPLVVEQGEGGLLSIALHPDYAHNGWIYLAFSDPGAGDTAMTKIVRGRLRDNRFTDIEPVFSVPLAMYPGGYVLFGCRMEFSGGCLFFSVGERGVLGDAQKLESANGKIHRVRDDGTIPPDNPFADRPGAVGSIWSLGHRNPQGLAFDPRTGMLWETEHGPRGGDELNRIERGRNYGWPVATYGINYDGTAITARTEADGMEPPVMHWTPSIATSQIAFYTGDRFPRWKSNLFLGSLAQQLFIRFEVDGGRIVHEEQIFRNLGRVRDIKTGPDGLLYVALEQIGPVSGRLVRLVPVE